MYTYTTLIKAFKAHYGSLLVDFLIEQIENGPIESGLIMPNIKQCMQLVNRAWYKVSENSIINCWGKCRIVLMIKLTICTFTIKLYSQH